MASATYEFTLNIDVNGKKYAIGDTVAESDIPPGYFASLKRMKQIVLVKEAAIDIPAEDVALNEPKPKRTK